MQTPAKYNDTYILSQGWGRNCEIKQHEKIHLYDMRYNYEPRGKHFILFFDQIELLTAWYSANTAMNIQNGYNHNTDIHPILFFTAIN